MNVSRLVKRAEDGRHGADCEMDIYIAVEVRDLCPIRVFIVMRSVLFS